MMPASRWRDADGENLMEAAFRPDAQGAQGLPRSVPESLYPPLGPGSPAPLSDEVLGKPIGGRAMSAASRTPVKE